MFFIIFFSLYTLVNTYIFIRGWQSLALYPQFRLVFTIFFLVAATSYIIAKIFSDQLTNIFYITLVWIGSFWFMYLFYLFLLIIMIDLVHLLDKIFNFLPSFVHQNQGKTKFILALVVIIITSSFALFGYINRSNIKLKELDISLSDQINKEYKIIFFSDLHISVVNNHSFLKSIVEKINSINPDLILIGGDLIDEKASKLREMRLADEIKNLRSKYGVYSVTGNHEFINVADETTKFLEELGIKFLRDEVILIDNSFYVIGREDYSKFYFTGKRRKILDELVKNLDKSIPKILIDHQPLNLNDAVDNGIALQLSGHTHHGQIAPANLITQLVYEVSWGYKKKDKTHIYVSSGIGTWGPPIKIGNDAELILIRLKL